MEDRLIITRSFFLVSSDCGYCKKKESSVFGFDCEQTTPEQYDLLINDGFRRSGRFFYKPDLINNCCEYFTIRTSLQDFKNGKEFNKIINKFNKFIGNKPNQSKEFNLNNELEKILKGNEDFKIVYESNEITDDKFELFKKYQQDIHNDTDLSKTSFKRFLCIDPFTSKGFVDSDTYDYELGAIHQCYYYKNKLIAIGVLDVLPSGLSSVYFIYDPEYKNLELGKLSTLLEMKLCSTLGLKHYYLGFYIPNITKMKYKKRYGGELKDPILKKWVSFDEEDTVVKRLESEITKYKRTPEELEKYKDDPELHPSAIIGEHYEDANYRDTVVFDMRTGNFTRGDGTMKQLVNLKRLIGGHLIEECIVKVI